MLINSLIIYWEEALDFIPDWQIVGFTLMLIGVLVKFDSDVSSKHKDQIKKEWAQLILCV